MNDKFYRGEMYYIYQTDYVGSEQRGGRPGIIVSNDLNNEYSRTVEVVFLTTREKPPLPTHVHISTAKKPSTALCEQVTTVDKRRFGEYAGEVTSKELEELNKAIAVGLALNLNMNTNKVILAWGKLLEENPGLLEWECDDDAPVETVPDVTVTEAAKQSVGEVDDANITNHPEYIRLAAERDVYKELYLNLIHESRSA